MRLSFDQAAKPQSGIALSVTQLNWQIKQFVESASGLQSVTVRGEVSNFRQQRGSGHCYFSLKDDTSQIRCCLWKFQAARVRFLPSDGDEVEVRGKIDFYERGGTLSLIVNSLDFAGQGALWEAFERLKSKLQKQGLFDPERKKPLPLFPKRIAVITSPSGAVWHDIVHVLERRWRLLEVIRIGAVVQGGEAPASLRAALQQAAAIAELDAVIIARGGGSMEDLWCFNDEALARQAAALEVPLISAVGHETDFTILDFVADKRAPTPSAAAELVTPNQAEVLQEISGVQARLARQSGLLIDQANQRLERLLHRARLAHPAAAIARQKEHLALLQKRCQNGAAHHVTLEWQQFEQLRGRLAALDPKKVLLRGYAIATNAQGEVVSTAKKARQEKVLLLTFHDGEVDVERAS